MLLKFIFTFFIFLVSFYSFSQAGCICNQAKNYDPLATENDGSCKYKKKKIRPRLSYLLADKLHETSGLIFYGDFWLTHNDDTENWLYALNETTFEIEKQVVLPNTKNIDWETLAQDSLHIYIGDFGNNFGNRTDLCIYKIEKSTLFDVPKIEKIQFSYNQQITFETVNRRHNFDCEAMVIKDSMILLFTKNWLDQTTDVYQLENKTGEQVAKQVINLKVNGLVTDACFVSDKNEILLSGYNKKLKPLIIKLKDFDGADFTKVNMRRYKVKLPFHQVEAIYTEDGFSVWLTNEQFFRKGLVDVKQQVHRVSLDN